MKRVTTVVLSIALMGSAIAAQAQQGTTAAATAKSPRKKMVPKASGPTLSAQLGEMKQAIDAQQRQIKQLTDLVQSRDQEVQQLEQRLDQSQTMAKQAQTEADTAGAQTAQQQQEVTALKSDVTDLKTTATNSALALQETQKSVKEMGSPMALHFKGVTLTPVGFLAAESVYRTRGLAADINSSFNSAPFGGASNGHMSEFFGSGRQSRVGMLAESKLSSAKVTGYWEADFLSAGVTSNNNQSNSYTLRQRQLWGQAALNNGWSFTGGQMWSLVTETSKGLDNRTEALPMTIDPQYTVGFSWARQYGFRATKNFNNKFWLGFSIENPQTTFAAHGQNNNFLLGSAGNGGGLFNATANYSFNESPDVIVKLAAEPGIGHYELFGIFSQFRDRVFPCATTGANATCGGVTGPSAAGAFNDGRAGGGVGGNARFTLYKKQVVLGAHALAGTGVGRYGTSGLPDATVRPDGTLALLKSYQALGTIEWHGKSLDVYLNGGGEYAGRTAYFNPVTGKGEGYGHPLFANSGCGTENVPGAGGFSPGSLSNCTGDTRVVLEGTVGFWYRLYNGPKGKLQFGPQYSYLTRNTWSGAGAVPGLSAQPKGIDNMIFTSFRYYLP